MRVFLSLHSVFYYLLFSETPSIFIKSSFLHQQFHLTVSRETAASFSLILSNMNDGCVSRETRKFMTGEKKALTGLFYTRAN